MLDEKLTLIHKHDKDISVLETRIAGLKSELAFAKQNRIKLVTECSQEMIESGCVNSIVGGLRFTVKATAQSVIISDESKLEKRFIREKITHTPNKVLIKEALKSGESVNGAMLSNGGATIQVTITKGE